MVSSHCDSQSLSDWSDFVVVTEPFRINLLQIRTAHDPRTPDLFLEPDVLGDDFKNDIRRTSLKSIGFFLESPAGFKLFPRILKSLMKLIRILKNTSWVPWQIGLATSTVERNRFLELNSKSLISQKAHFSELVLRSFRICRFAHCDGCLKLLPFHILSSHSDTNSKGLNGCVF